MYFTNAGQSKNLDGSPVLTNAYFFLKKVKSLSKEEQRALLVKMAKHLHSNFNPKSLSEQAVDTKNSLRIIEIGRILRERNEERLKKNNEDSDANAQNFKITTAI